MFDHIFQVLDQELAKATRVIEKSKKISEVQVIPKSFAKNTYFFGVHQHFNQHLLFQRLMHDNDVAGRKLVSQEEDWRLQNQTLLEELQKLVIRYLWKIVKIFKSDCSGTKSLRRSMRRLGNENWKGSLTSFPWRLDFEQILTSDKCLSA